MSTIKLQRTGDAPLRLEGQLLVESKGQLQTGREQIRWHDLAVYQLAEGFAVAIGYRSSWEGELNADLAEIVNTPAGVAQLLKSYDPAGRVRGFPEGKKYDLRQQKLLADVRDRYRAQVSEVLDCDALAVD